MIRNLKHLFNILKTSKEEIKFILSNINDYYYTKKEPKFNSNGSQKIKNGKLEYRVLTPSTGQLKAVQVLIKHRILKKFNFPEFIQGGVQKRDNITNALKHKGKKYHFNTDIKSFFPSIKYKQIYNMFIAFQFSADVSSILTKLTTYNYCLPQGTPTSTYLANLASLYSLDTDLIPFCSSKKIIYTRYVDDLTFSSSRNFKEEVPNIISIINKNGYTISHRKTYYKVGTVEITGIVTKNNVIDAPISKKQKLLRNDLSETSKKSISNYIKRIKRKNE